MSASVISASKLSSKAASHSSRQLTRDTHHAHGVPGSRLEEPPQRHKKATLIYHQKTKQQLFTRPRGDAHHSATPKRASPLAIARSWHGLW